MRRILCALALAVGAGACGGAGADVGGQCVPGESITCACASGAAGAQVCKSDKTFAPCVCAGGGSGDGGDDGGISVSDDDTTDYVALIANGASEATMTTYWHTNCVGGEQGLALASDGSARFQDPYPFSTVQSITWQRQSSDDLLLSPIGPP